VLRAAPRLPEPWTPFLNGAHPSSPNLIATHCACGSVDSTRGRLNWWADQFPSYSPISENFIPFPGLLAVRHKRRPAQLSNGALVGSGKIMPVAQIEQPSSSAVAHHDARKFQVFGYDV